MGGPWRDPEAPGGGSLFPTNRGPRIRADDASQTASGGPRPGNRPSAREPNRFRPDVSQFVDAGPPGSDRRRERRRNRSLRGERLNSAMRFLLRGSHRKPETEPSVSVPAGTRHRAFCLAVADFARIPLGSDRVKTPDLRSKQEAPSGRSRVMFTLIWYGA